MQQTLFLEVITFTCDTYYLLYIHYVHSKPEPFQAGRHEGRMRGTLQAIEHGAWLEIPDEADAVDLPRKLQSSSHVSAVAKRPRLDGLQAMAVFKLFGSLYRHEAFLNSEGTCDVPAECWCEGSRIFKCPRAVWLDSYPLGSGGLRFTERLRLVASLKISEPRLTEIGAEAQGRIFARCPTALQIQSLAGGFSAPLPQC